MSLLVYDKAIRREVATLIRKGQVTRIAAPYWSAEALNALDIRDKNVEGSLQLICNLFATATDPKMIKQLITLGAEVRINHELHAKVYINEKEAIIGSANVSAPAFGLNPPVTQHEMCVRVTDEDSLNDLNVWWERIWEDSTPLVPGKGITKQLLAHAAYVRRLEAQKQNLWEALQRNPDHFDAVYVVVDWEPYNKKVENAVKERNADNHGVEIDAWQDWPKMPPASELISFCSDNRRSRMEFQGVWRSPDKVVLDSVGATYVTLLPGVRGYRFVDDKRVLAAVTRYRDVLTRKPGSDGGWMLLADFAKQYMGLDM